MTPHQIIADHTPLGDGFSAEFRADGSIAISHEQGGLHMANSSEAAMAHEIKRLRALVAECRAPSAEATELLGRAFEALHLWRRRVERWRRRVRQPSRRRQL